MSRNTKYIVQFDENAGKPADFDSLFIEKDNEIIAKKRIRMTDTRKRTAAMLSAAAVITIVTAAGLNIISSSGGISSEQGISEFAGGAETAVTEAVYGEIYLSDLIGRFDYDISPESEFAVSAAAASDEITADVVMYARVAMKEVNKQNGLIEYTIVPDGRYYVRSGDESLLVGDTVTVSGIAGAADRLQIGSEYILFLDSSENYDTDFVISSDNPYAARLTESGWIMDSSFPVQGDINVIADVHGYENESITLEPSDSVMASKLEQLLNDYSLSDKEKSGDFDTGLAERSLKELMSDNSFFASLEAVRFSEDENGEEKFYELVLDNEEYFELKPYLDGTVMYEGENINGELMLVLDLDDESEQCKKIGCSAVMFTGLDSTMVKSGDEISGEEVIAGTSEKPIYCRFIDKYGRIISFS